MRANVKYKQVNSMLVRCKTLRLAKIEEGECELPRNDPRVARLYPSKVKEQEQNNTE